MTTQYATASYQEVIDLHTESDHVSVVGIHTPNSDTPYRMLRGFWEQFRKFKYNGCSLSLVPAARLPVDPLQVSYDAGEPTIDSRDVLNPILFHGCHGDDMGAILNSLYAGNSSTVMPFAQSDSTEFNEIVSNQYTTDFFESLYYRALTDNTWLKAHPQKGFRKNGLHPMVYSVASSVQLNPIANINGTNHLFPQGTSHDDDGNASTSYDGSFGVYNGGGNLSVNVGGFGRPVVSTDGGLHYEMSPNRSMIQFFTPRLQRLGWMDTHQVVGVSNGVSTTSDDSSNLGGMYVGAASQLKPALLGKLFMGMIMLPPAYKTEQYFRLILNHSFSFAKFRGASMQYLNKGEVDNAYSVFNFNSDDSKKGGDDPVDEYKQ